MYYIYILYSEKADKYYVGYSEDYLRRVHEHNHSPRLGFTAKYRPWVLKAVFQCSQDEAIAIRIERFIKRQKSRKFLETIINAESLTGVLANLVRVPNSRD